MSKSSFDRASRTEAKPFEGGALSPSSTPELRIENTFNKETFVFAAEEIDPTAARFNVILASGGSGGGNALVHIHPGASETFTVISGRLAVTIDGVERIVTAVQSITIPSGAPTISEMRIPGKPRRSSRSNLPSSMDASSGISRC